MSQSNGSFPTVREFLVGRMVERIVLWWKHPDKVPPVKAGNMSAVLVYPSNRREATEVWACRCIFYEDRGGAKYCLSHHERGSMAKEGFDAKSLMYVLVDFKGEQLAPVCRACAEAIMANGVPDLGFDSDGARRYLFRYAGDQDESAACISGRPSIILDSLKDRRTNVVQVAAK